jgi:hypothetical protein
VSLSLIQRAREMAQYCGAFAPGAADLLLEQADYILVQSRTIKMQANELESLRKMLAAKEGG